MIIAVDFDGTLVEHKYPDIGNEAPFAFAILRTLQEQGHQLILYTMRSGRELFNAVQFCQKRGVTFWGVNENPDQHTWTDSRKVFAHLYIDDAAYGVPTKPATEIGLRPVVDWSKIEIGR